MIGAIADTHAVIWYLLDSPRLSRRAAAEFERCQTAGMLVGVSSMTIIEIVYLIQYLRQLRRAGRGLGPVNAAQRSQLLEDACQYNWLRFFRKHFDGFSDIFGAPAQRLQVPEVSV